MLDRRLGALAEVISEGFMEIRDGCLMQSNANLTQVSGRAGSSLAGLQVTELFREEGDGLPRAEGPGTLECTLRTSDGRSRSGVCRRAFSEEAPRAGSWTT